jgi:hypothetical protein
VTDREAALAATAPAGLGEQARALGPADVVVGIASYNNAPTIGAVVETVRVGLQKHFADARSLLVNSDGGSSDETPGLVAAAEWAGARLLVRHQASPGERLSAPYHGIPGRAAAQQAILETARLVEARVCVFVESDCRSLTTEWVERLVRPILEDRCDYVTPLYQRHRYHGTLTSGLIYPLVRSLYGARLWPPLGGQTGLSGRFVVHLCQQDVWGTGLLRHGADLWITATAITDRFPVAAAWLGPYTVDSPTRGVDLATTLVQTTEPLFALLERTADAWTEIHGSVPVSVVGTPLALGVDPLDLNVEGMVRAFRLGLKDLLPLWEQVLAPETLAEVLSLDLSAYEGLRFRHDLWARVVYDFALAYHLRILYREHLLRSLVPLYLGRTAAFIRETTGVDGPATERWIEQSCRAFEAQKPYLVERWQ